MGNLPPSYARWAEAVFIAVPLAYEAWALFNGRGADTLSAVMWTFAQSGMWRMILPFLWGMLTVHFFLTPYNTPWLLIGMGFGSAIFMKKGDLHL